MPIPFRAFVIVVAIALPCGLGGCGTVNDRITPGIVDAIPHWAGGLPADVPPRPGTPQYDEFMRERERKRLEPAPPKEEAAKAAPQSASGLDAVH
jgi:hypothetical protein